MSLIVCRPMAGTKITLFLPTDNPQGLKVAEVSNWSGKALAAPRSAFRDLLARQEMKQAGIYCLTGIDATTSRPTAYIGEAETLGSRLRMHQERDFWVQASVFLSKDDNLTKSHTRYLEGRLISEVRNAGGWDLENSLSSGAKLPEADRAEMDVFFGRVAQLLPLLGCDLLKMGRSAVAKSPLICRINSLRAYGYRTADGFLVLKGSEVAPDVRPSVARHAPWIILLRKQLIAQGALVSRRDRAVFTEDVEFSSPSRAASVVRGGNANGLTEWRDDSGVLLKDIESRP